MTDNADDQTGKSQTPDAESDVPPTEIPSAENATFGAAKERLLSSSLSLPSEFTDALASAGPSETSDFQGGSSVDETRPKGVADTTEALPRMLGRYRLERLVGKGGMGRVYLAFDEQLKRKVALKLPSADSAERADLRLRLLREAKAAASIAHPNICSVYDAGTVDDTLFLTMEFIEGRTLADILAERGRFGVEESVTLVANIARAMAFAHGGGVVHRDLKPSNIMLRDSGEPVVTDFGLARMTTGDDVTKLTSTGAVIGTPAYMSPEQINGDLAAIGPATDIYGLGVILYEILAGHPPFRGAPGAVLGKALYEPPPPLDKLGLGIPAALARTCERALAKQPSSRFENMEDFANALYSAILAAFAGDQNQPTGWQTLSDSAKTFGRSQFPPKWLSYALAGVLLAAFGGAPIHRLWKNRLWKKYDGNDDLYKFQLNLAAGSFLAANAGQGSWLTTAQSYFSLPHRKPPQFSKKDRIRMVIAYLRANWIDDALNEVERLEDPAEAIPQADWSELVTAMVAAIPEVPNNDGSTDLKLRMLELGAESAKSAQPSLACECWLRHGNLLARRRSWPAAIKSFAAAVHCAAGPVDKAKAAGKAAAERVFASDHRGLNDDELVDFCLSGRSFFTSRDLVSCDRARRLVLLAWLKDDPKRPFVRRDFEGLVNASGELAFAKLDASMSKSLPRGSSGSHFVIGSPNSPQLDSSRPVPAGGINALVWPSELAKRERLSATEKQLMAAEWGRICVATREFEAFVKEYQTSSLDPIVRTAMQPFVADAYFGAAQKLSVEMPERARALASVAQKAAPMRVEIRQLLSKLEESAAIFAAHTGRIGQLVESAFVLSKSDLDGSRKSANEAITLYAQIDQKRLSTTQVERLREQISNANLALCEIEAAKRDYQAAFAATERAIAMAPNHYYAQIYQATTGRAWAISGSGEIPLSVFEKSIRTACRAIEMKPSEFTPCEALLSLLQLRVARGRSDKMYLEICKEPANQKTAARITEAIIATAKHLNETGGDVKEARSALVTARAMLALGGLTNRIEGLFFANEAVSLSARRKFLPLYILAVLQLDVGNLDGAKLSIDDAERAVDVARYSIDDLKALRERLTKSSRR